MDEIVCDVLVVGSGASGFATALTARHLGLDVLIAEKEPFSIDECLFAHRDRAP